MDVSHVANNGLEQNIVSQELWYKKQGGGSESVEEFGDGKRVSKEKMPSCAEMYCSLSPIISRALILSFRASERQHVSPIGDPSPSTVQCNCLLNRS